MSSPFISGSERPLCEFCSWKGHKPLPVRGEGERRILIVGEAPGVVELQKGQVFVGPSGQLLQSALKDAGLDLDRDCWVTNAVRCGPLKTPQDIEACRPALMNVLRAYQPQRVLALGGTAVRALNLDKLANLSATDWAGLRVARPGYFVYPTYHPAFLLRGAGACYEALFNHHIRMLAEDTEEPPTRTLEEWSKRVRCVTPEEALACLDQIPPQSLVAVDIETNCLRLIEGSRILSLAFAFGEPGQEQAVACPFHPDLLSRLARGFRLVGCNCLRFENAFFAAQGRALLWYLDIMISQHILDCRPGICGLKFQASMYLGVDGYEEEVAPFMKSPSGQAFNRLSQLPLSKLLLYNGLDALFTLAVAYQHLPRLKQRQLWDGLRLFMAGGHVLAKMERRGLVISPAIRDRLQRVNAQMQRLTHQLEKDPVYQKMRQLFPRPNLNSNHQIATVLYDKRGLGLTPTAYTKSGTPYLGKDALQQIGLAFCRRLLQYRKLRKARDFLKEIQDRLVREDGVQVLHPSFLLHTTRTYRSSSCDPNFQNLPSRDASASRLIRSLFLPRPDHCFLECDYSGIEVRIAACYTQDPELIAYLKEGRDLHADTAKTLFKKTQVSKFERYVAKNQFVFPEFYGSYYVPIAKQIYRTLTELPAQSDLWEIKNDFQQRFPDYESFESHVREVENKFWKRFAVYAQWKEEWEQQYNRTGAVRLFTGFEIRRPMTRNEVINGAIQGTAFHCLLWSLVRLQRRLREYKLPAHFLGQIHDSVLMEVPITRIDEVKEVTRRVMEEEIRQQWPWLVVPLRIEMQVHYKNWFD